MFTDGPGSGVGFAGLLEAAREGAEWALEALYRDLAPRVLGYLRGQGVPEAEDVASEAFVQVVRGLGSFEGDERAFRSWVFSIAHNRMVDQYRRRSRRPEAPIDPVELDAAMAPSLIGEAEELVEAKVPGPVAGAVLGLSSDQRAVVLLRIVADLSVVEVAGLLGKSPGAVKALQHRALLSLERELEGERVT